MKKIYLIKSEEEIPRYKIGISYRPDKRLKQLQTSSPNELTMIKEFVIDNSYKTESTVHRTYSRYHQRGEWFFLPEEEVNKFEQTVLEIDKNFNFIKENSTLFFSY